VGLPSCGLVLFGFKGLRQNLIMRDRRVVEKIVRAREYTVACTLEMLETNLHGLL
jgi:hypothetical protein